MCSTLTSPVINGLFNSPFFIELKQTIIDGSTQVPITSPVVGFNPDGTSMDKV